MIAANLDRLYDYMVRRLLEATSHNDIGMIDEVMGLLLEIKSGWDGIRQEYVESQPSLRPAPVAAASSGEARTADTGLSPEERAMLLKQPFVVPVSLGPRIMRADTAAVACLALVNAVLGDWR